jgi:stage II sporulation protein D
MLKEENHSFPLRIEPVDKACLLEVEFLVSKKRLYRGLIEIRKTPAGSVVINEVGLEEYLAGVIPSEMPPSWPLEALKAQAIAARTYALNSIGKNASKGYDVVDSTDDQVYLGAAKERESTNRAITETAGQVLLHNGKLISAQYCADCGGITQSAANVGKEAPCLQSVSDQGPEGDYCKNGSSHVWSAKLTSAQFALIASKSIKKELGAIRDVVVLERDETGRVSRIEVLGEKGKADIAGTTFRMTAGPTVIKSTNFDLKQDADGNFHFAGKGCGHGLGLCQWGAAGRAFAGQRHAQILETYYVGSSLEQLRANSRAEVLSLISQAGINGSSSGPAGGG